MHGELLSPFSSENESRYTANALRMLEKFGSSMSGRDPLTQEARREELYELFENAPSSEVLQYLLYKSQYYIDTAFAIEAAEEHRLPKALWPKFIRALLHKDPDFPDISFDHDVAACFGQGLFRHPEARYYALRYLAEQKSVLAGPLVAHSDLLVPDERVLMEEWVRAQPLIYANTSKMHLEKRHTPMVVGEWDEAASLAAKALVSLPLQERLEAGAIFLTPEISSHTSLRPALTEVRGSCIDDQAKKIERLLLKYLQPLEHGIKRGGVVDYDSTKKFRTKVRELFESLPFPAEVRHQAILLAVRRLPIGADISLSYFVDMEAVAATPMDRRVMLEFAAKEMPIPTQLGHDYSLVGWLRGSGVSFKDGVVDEEDAVWTKQRVLEMVKDVDPKDYHRSEIFTDVIDICLASGIPIEREWIRSAGVALPSELMMTSFLRDQKAGTSSERLQRMSATDRAYAAERLLSAIDRQPATEREVALNWLKSFLAEFPLDALSAHDRTLINRSLKRIFQKVLEKPYVDDKNAQAFLEAVKGFCKKITTEITDEVIRSFYDAATRLSPELRSEFYRDVETLSLDKAIWTFNAATLERWETLYQHYPEEYKKLRKDRVAFSHALCQPVSSEYLIPLLERSSDWNTLCEEMFFEKMQRMPFRAAMLAEQRGRDQGVVDRLDHKWAEHKKEFDKRWGTEKIVSYFLDISPQEARKKGLLIGSLPIKDEEIYAAPNPEALIHFACDYVQPFQALLERLTNHSVNKAILLRVIHAKDHVAELARVERMVDEYEKPGSEAEHLVRLMMDLVMPNNVTLSKLEGLMLPASLGGADLASLKQEELERIMFERVDKILSISKQSHADASRRNANLVREAGAAGPRLQRGTLLHWTDIEALPSMLSQGNLCGESLGVHGGVDRYPFHLDTVAILDEHADQSLEEAFKDSRLLYDGAPIAIVYPYRHQSEAFAFGEEYPILKSNIYGHHLLFGGLPKTEVGYLLVNEDTEASPELLQKVKASIVQGEVFLPIYSLKGKLLFDEQEYIDLYLKTKPYGTVAQFLADESWMDQLDVEQNETHEFTLKRHLLLAESYAVEYAQRFELDPARARLVRVAARLHDVGKLEDGPQALSNVDAAERWLGKVRRVPREEMRAIRRLIHHDELLGDVLQETEIDIYGKMQISEEGQRQLERFRTIFPTVEDQRMLLAIYMADVRAIGNGKFREWRVEEKIKALGLADFSR